ncbi:adenylosuccinate synthetase [Buchnera aphidicola (Nipponaphis monzeni)]|uniref:Adenylosuccinate synthetase n=1 Tax=Buchnera aphidicola (Nipponaphis monzeni) TaxID=2495405 RepID=A0A455TAR6_9GAMM|nr:adenylosuccinate synthase [Buchnera aphidicola]BBI01431.1 adenylosuccinate synthetase [Buchnera aphidicola (Nipponaphis monzeni)]
MAKNVVVLGMQWGDEGKGKIVDFLTEKVKYIVRYQGGHNAGHTIIVNNNRIILHLIPSGILNKHKICIIGNGVVVSPSALVKEINMLKKHNVSIKNRLIISGYCSLVLKYHVAMDKAREEIDKIGTTGCGIGPAYEDKVARRSLRIGDLNNENFVISSLEKVLRYYNHQLVHFYHKTPILISDVLQELLQYKDLLLDLVGDVPIILCNAIKNNLSIMFEGSQGFLLDVDHGSYPYVTSSNTISGGVTAGAGVGPTQINNVIGVSKSYTTRVGSGPFPTEILDGISTHLCTKGREFGTTTGRRRRIGWLDTVIIKRSIQINSVTSLCLTKLDVLDDLNELKICIGYKNSKTGKCNMEIPYIISDWDIIEPIYEILPGWSQSCYKITQFNLLPIEAKNYILRIEEILEIPISIVSTGPSRLDTIILKDINLR